LFVSYPAAGDILIFELGHANPDPDLGAGLR
jgi:hypothetical protein